MSNISQTLVFDRNIYIYIIYIERETEREREREGSHGVCVCGVVKVDIVQGSALFAAVFVPFI